MKELLEPDNEIEVPRWAKISKNWLVKSLTVKCSYWGIESKAFKLLSRWDGVGGSKAIIGH